MPRDRSRHSRIGQRGSAISEHRFIDPKKERRPIPPDFKLHLSVASFARNLTFDRVLEGLHPIYVLQFRHGTSFTAMPRNLPVCSCITNCNFDWTQTLATNPLCSRGSGDEPVNSIPTDFAARLPRRRVHVEFGFPTRPKLIKRLHPTLRLAVALVRFTRMPYRAARRGQDKVCVMPTCLKTEEISRSL